MDNRIHIQELVSKATNKTATADELEELLQLIRQDDNGDVTKEIEQMFAGEPQPLTQSIDWHAFTKQIVTADRITKANRPIHRVHILRTAWIRYAAAIILIAGIGTWVYINNSKEKPSVTQTNPVPLQNDVAPGGNRATLTLADGSKIILDSAATGTIATEGATKITKINNQVVYVSPASGGGREAAGGGRISYNTMSTPRGGQYRLTLPDGSQVWLNAESSITYPTSFAERERRVSVTGEAYFEVTHDKTKPFRVECKQVGHPERSEGSPDGGGLDIEVLGTHFNVNAYKDEATINTTLLEGSVRLKTTSPFSLLPSTSLTLTPGQQGQLQGNRLSLAPKPDIDQVMAWKNGYFMFNHANLQTVMRELARWYDLEVEYQAKIPDEEFGGSIERNIQLSEVLKMLERSGIHFRIEKKKLIVLP